MSESERPSSVVADRPIGGLVLCRDDDVMLDSARLGFVCSSTTFFLIIFLHKKKRERIHLVIIYG